MKSNNPYRSAIQIAKTIDLSGSLLNILGYAALQRGIEADGDDKIERNGGWLCSEYHLKKAMKPMVASENDAGINGVQFEDYGKMLAYLLCLYGLDAVACNPNQLPVEFSIMLDGADLSLSYLSHQ
jgi:hypothetical protein